MASLVEQYDPWIRTITRRMFRKYQEYYPYQDLLSTAYLAAVEAEITYDPSIGKFSAYVKPRVEGAITRAVSSITNIQHRALRKMWNFIEDYISAHDRVPAQHIIMKHLGLTKGQYMDLLDATSTITIISPDSLSEEDMAKESDVEMLAEFDRVSGIVQTLPVKDQKRISQFMQDPNQNEGDIKDILVIIRDKLEIKETFE